LTELAFWYFCDTCNTEWEGLTVQGYSLNGYPCSYCGATTTRFIGWSDDECCQCEFDIDHLVELTKEPSYKMPSGLTREQRREWAKSVLEQGDESRED